MHLVGPAGGRLPTLYFPLPGSNSSGFAGLILELTSSSRPCGHHVSVHSPPSRIHHVEVQIRLRGEGGVLFINNMILYNIMVIILKGNIYAIQCRIFGKRL